MGTTPEILAWRGFRQDARKTGSVKARALSVANQPQVREGVVGQQAPPASGGRGFAAAAQV